MLAGVARGVCHPRRTELELREAVQAIVVTRCIEDTVDEQVVPVNSTGLALGQVVVVPARDAQVDPVQHEPIVGKNARSRG